MSHVKTAPPGVLPGVDQEDGGGSFACLAFLMGEAVTGAYLTKSPDSGRDLPQLMRDLAEHTLHAGEPGDMTTRIHKCHVGMLMRKIKREVHKGSVIPNPDSGLDLSKIQTLAVWQLHIKTAMDVTSPCIMHVVITVPWLVDTFEDLPTYFGEIGDQLQAIYGSRPCWNEAFDNQDVIIDLVTKEDFKMSFDIVK